MSLTWIINYDTPGNFTYDGAKIEVTTDAHLLLADKTGETFNQPFTASAGFTFDATKTEFVAGKCQQKLFQQANATIYCDYLVDEDAVYSAGVGTGTLNGGASVAGGKLDLTGGILAYCDYASASNFAGSNVGCIRIIGYRPNYSGTPVSNQNLINIHNGVNDNWLCAFAHITGTGNLVFALRDGAAANIYSVTSYGVWNPTSGVTYDIEINWDLTTGATRLFIDGTQFGSTKTDTGTYTPSGLTNIYIGTNRITVNLADYDVEGYIIYTTVQHTSNFSPVTLYRYYEDLITLPQFSYAGLGAIQDYTAYATTQTGLIRMNVNGEYWTGTAWAASDDSYAQMNAPATINTNIGSLSVIDTVDIKMRTQDINIQMDIDDLTVTYTGQEYNTTDPPIIVNAGQLMDGLDGFAETSTKPGAAEVKYTLHVDGTPTYWSGAAWVTSADTYAQANTATEIETNKAALNLSSGKNVKVKAFLHSTGVDNPLLDSVTVDYNFFVAPLYPTKCIVYGWVLKHSSPVANVEVKVDGYEDFLSANNLLYIHTTTTTDAAGYWELDLYETTTVNQEVIFRFSYPTDPDIAEVVFTHILIPNQATIPFDTLATGKKEEAGYYRNIDELYYKQGWFKDV